jgi:hypothetical protein
VAVSTVIKTLKGDPIISVVQVRITVRFAGSLAVEQKDPLILSMTRSSSSVTVHQQSYRSHSLAPKQVRAVSLHAQSSCQARKTFEKQFSK